MSPSHRLASGSWHRFATRLGLGALVLCTLAAAGSSGAPSAPAVLPDGALHPTNRQRLLAPRIADILEQSHYRGLAIDERIADQVLQRFLDELDGQRSYFLASDVAEFEHFRGQFGQMIHDGRIDPAFQIFATFQQRNRERLRFALAQLAHEPDWTREERFSFDRQHVPWPKSPAELDELWRLRVKNDAITLALAGKNWADSAEVLRKRYEHALTRLDQVSADDLFEILMNAYAAIYDPHTNYFSPRNSEEYRIQMSLSYEGIGASLQLQDDYVTISDLIPGGAAALAGSLKVSDRITAVAQGHEGTFTDVIGWRLDDVVQLIRGKLGTLVRLQVLPAGATPGNAERIIELTRNKVQLEARAAHRTVREIKRADRTLKVGVITVPSFYQDIAASSAGDKDFRSTTRDVKRLLEELAAGGGVDALVLDLRGDGGGYLPEATALTGLFIDSGPVVQIKDGRGQIEVLNDPDPKAAYHGPLTVLVDRTSASASEIFAGAIQDYRRGLVLGQTTFGKGTVQSLLPLDRWSDQPVDGQITVTVGKFYRVTGESTQLRGVEPDIVLPSGISAKDFGESTLDYALPWDRILPARFQPAPGAPQMVQQLLAAEDTRAPQNADYQWLLKSLSQLDDARKEKSVSLNLVQRRAERLQLEQSRLTAENDRRRADGLAAVKTLEDIPAAEAPDVVLNEATQISADYALWSAAGAPGPATQTAHAEAPPSAAQRSSTR